MGIVTSYPMKKGSPGKVHKQADSAKRPERVVFFDLLRILFVAIIVYDHSRYELVPLFNNLFFSDGQNFFNIYINGITGLSIYGMILISGAVLEYNYRGIERLSEYTKFLFRRFLRLYPAFWMSLFFGIIVFPSVLQEKFWEIVAEFTGFFYLLGMGPGNINEMGWFIGAIFALYIIFPYLSRLMKKNPLAVLVACLVISYASRFILVQNDLFSAYALWRWLPICNLFEFSLGIYLVQACLYPKNTRDYPLVREAAELSFYVFLFHVIIMKGFVAATDESVRIFFLTIASKDVYLAFSLHYVTMIAIVLVVSYIAMVADRRLQKALFANERIKRFLA